MALQEQYDKVNVQLDKVLASLDLSRPELKDWQKVKTLAKPDHAVPSGAQQTLNIFFAFSATAGARALPNRSPPSPHGGIARAQSPLRAKSCAHQARMMK
ncbi:hypothetical protein BC940DRAFT_48101 [Gongronella butleri]|nr:hypothetical protein BC940DRAFT_48101 [Gongronella butleri]